jgi:hypothetical protein
MRLQVLLNNATADHGSGNYYVFTLRLGAKKRSERNTYPGWHIAGLGQPTCTLKALGLQLSQRQWCI